MNLTKLRSSGVAVECSSLCLFTKHNLLNPVLVSTPLYQVISHALSDKSNKTKFTLLFSNVTEKDILLRDELDELRKQHPDTFDVVYLVDNPEKGWTGAFSFPLPSYIA
jgi:NAD(P)H-flavin reductase